MSSKNSQNVLVLGGAGFIGKSVCLNLINNGHFVRILDNLSSQVHGALPDQLDWISDHRIDFIRGSISDKDILLKSLQGRQHLFAKDYLNFFLDQNYKLSNL